MNADFHAATVAGITGAPLPAAGQRAARTALRPRSIVGLVLAATASFHLGFLHPAMSGLVLVWLGCLFALRRTSCGRWSFYTGLAIGLGMYAPQLYFFWIIFGPAAIALWFVLAFWIALFLLLLHGVDRYWGTGWAVKLTPVLWLGLEYFRSELYYLRFAWFTAGSFMPPTVSWPLLRDIGVYGLGALLAWLAAWIVSRLEAGAAPRKPQWRAVVALTALVTAYVGFGVVLPLMGVAKLTVLPVAGVQLEFPGATEVLDHLRRFAQSHPEARVIALSEYTFDGPVPDNVRAWCRQNQRWLIAGGKEPLEGGRFYNTAYVVSTNGDVVFQQAKTVPIQFFNDGIPAPRQQVWESPWGPIGIGICYDLNYARVVDELIRQGALALIVPAMDVESWGLHEHRLNARLAPIRAAEHGVPILRVASAGFSQLISRRGVVEAATTMPGQGEIIAGQLRWSEFQPPGLPLDRYLAPLAVVATGVIMLLLSRSQAQARRSAMQNPVPPPQPDPAA